jgi:thioredoxin
MLTMHTIQLSTQEFQEKIFNYRTEKEWKYTGELPAIVDFYADWCAPCRMVAPILEDLAKEYDGRLLIYKVNTEKEPELAAVFGIQSIPSFLFIPVNNEPSLQPGALPKNAFKQVIEEHLLQTSAA